MNKKILNLLATGTLLISYSGNSFANCIVKGEAGMRKAQTNGWELRIQPGPNGYIWDDSQNDPYYGNALGSSIGGVVEGNDLVFRGRPTTGGFAYGIYPSVSGSRTAIQASMLVSIDWKPDAREVCTAHKFDKWTQKRTCVQKGIENVPTSFVVDITTNANGRPHYSKQFNNVNSLNRYWIDMPELICDGDINLYEARILDLNGGEVTFKVHQMEFNKYWRY